MSEYVKPEFANEKLWKAYLVLEAVAKDRDYRELGFSLVSKLISGHLGITSNQKNSQISNILHALEKEPYQWISRHPYISFQIFVKPISEVAEKIEEGN